MEREILECLRCQWKWMSRVDIPLRCPRCQSPKWNVPEEAGAPEKIFYGKDKLKYPVGDLQLGEVRNLAWIRDAEGRRDMAANEARFRAVGRWAKRNGQVFRLTGDIHEGLIVKRIK